jgi:hypothetical protein
VPHAGNPIYRLAAALGRLAAFDFPVHLSETTRGYFAVMATQESGPLASDLAALGREPTDLARRELAAAHRCDVVRRLHRAVPLPPADQRLAIRSGSRRPSSSDYRTYLTRRQGGGDVCAANRHEAPPPNTNIQGGVRSRQRLEASPHGQ